MKVVRISDQCMIERIFRDGWIERTSLSELVTIPTIYRTERLGSVGMIYVGDYHSSPES